MASWFHATILATALAATVAVGLASAAIYIGNNSSKAAPRADRLSVVANASGYVTIETRHDSISVLKRIRVN